MLPAILVIQHLIIGIESSYLIAFIRKKYLDDSRGLVISNIPLLIFKLGLAYAVFLPVGWND